MKKSKGVAFALCAFTGLFGSHRFYLGETGMGILMLCTAGLGGVLWIADFSP